MLISTDKPLTHLFFVSTQANQPIPVCSKATDSFGARYQLFEPHMSNGSLFGEGNVEMPDKESPLASLAECDGTDERACGMLLDNNAMSVCNVQSKDQQVMETTVSSQSMSANTVQSNDGQFKGPTTRLPSQVRAVLVDRVGEIGMMVSLGTRIGSCARILC